jgi:hypothetical protein
VALLWKICAPFTDNKATVNCVHHTKLSVWRLGLKHVPNIVAMSHSVWKQQNTLLKHRFLYRLSVLVIFFYMSIMRNAFTYSSCFTYLPCLPIQFSIMHIRRKGLSLVLHYILPWDHYYFKSILKFSFTCVSLLSSWSRASFTISKQILQTSSLSGGSCWCSHTVWIQCFTAPHDLADLSKQIIFNH